jgi:hypothetical protein
MMLFEQPPKSATESGSTSVSRPGNQGRGHGSEDAVITDFFLFGRRCRPGAQRRPFLKMHSTENCHQIL